MPRITVSIYIRPGLSAKLTMGWEAHHEVLHPRINRFMIIIETQFVRNKARSCQNSRRPSYGLVQRVSMSSLGRYTTTDVSDMPTGSFTGTTSVRSLLAKLLYHTTSIYHTQRLHQASQVENEMTSLGCIRLATFFTLT